MTEATVMESIAAEPTVVAAASQFRMVAIDKIVESRTNPRRHFDPVKLAELADNIKKQGVLVPLLVRPCLSHPKGVDFKPSLIGEYLELIAGARRYRAAKLAGLAELPVRVVDLTDAETLEVQLIENLQREDVHPLEEGEGFQRLLDIEGYTVDRIAEKVGRDRSYIYKRLQLAKLAPSLKDKFVNGEIQIAHAIVLSRLTERDQALAEKEGLFHHHWNGARQERVVVTAAQLDSWIRQEIYLDLTGVPWSKSDAELVPEAGACNTCPKRSGTNIHLFDDIGKKNDVCLDAECYGKKRQARLVQIEKASADKGEKLVRVATEHLNSADESRLKVLGSGHYESVGAKKPCAHAEKALVVSGRVDVGKIISICRTSLCKTHHPYAAKLSRAAGGANSFAQDWAEKRRALVNQIKRQVCRRMLRAVLAKPMKWDVPHAQLQVVARALMQFSLPVEVPEALDLPSMPAASAGKKLKNGAAVSGWLKDLIAAPKGSPAADALPRIVMALALYPAVKEYVQAADVEALEAAADAARVDRKAIQKATTKELTADFEKRKAKAKLADDAKKADAKKKAARAAPASKGSVPEAAASVDAGDEGEDPDGDE